MAVNARNGLLKLTSRWNNEAVLNPKEILIMPSRKSRDFSHGMDRLTQRPFGHFFFWIALYF